MESTHGAEIESDLEVEPADPAIPLWEILGCSSLVFLHLAVGALGGLLQFGPGARYWSLMGFWDPFLHFAFFGLVLHFVLVLPFSTLARAGWENLGSRALRVAVATLIVGLPLFSFGYYRGGIKVAMDFHELFLATLLPAAVAALFYERVRRPTVLTLALAPAIYGSLYVVGDFMTPLPVLFSVVPQGPAFYVVRSLLPWSALFLALWLNRGPRFGEVTPSEGVRNFSLGLVVVTAYGWMVQFLVPLLAARLDPGGVVPQFNWDLSFLLTFVASVLLLFRKPFARTLLQGLCAATIVIWMIRLATLLRSGQAEFTQVTWATTALLAVGATGALFTALQRPWFRDWFQVPPPG